MTLFVVPANAAPAVNAVYLNGDTTGGSRFFGTSMASSTRTPSSTWTSSGLGGLLAGFILIPALPPFSGRQENAENRP